LSFFISEISSNHSCSLDRALEFVDVSADIGCDAAKFQLFKINQLFAPEVLRVRQDVAKRKAWELPLEFIPKIAKRCQERKIQFSCTPFYLEAVKELNPFVDFFKVASYELLWDDLLKTCAETGKPMVLSTGMATIEEIAHAVKVLKKGGCKEVTLLHCNSSYPTPPKDCNLAAIDTLRNHFEVAAGWSDHTRNAAVVYRAVHRYQASMVEFHLDLDGKGEEFHFGHCWLPDEMKTVIQTVKSGFLADGTGVHLFPTGLVIFRQK
jgi:N-acetylneuraminate synthase